jgi:hypothetical protein
MQRVAHSISHDGGRHALAEPVDAKAKDLAAKRLAQIAAKAAKKAAVMAKPKPAALRAALLRRGA